MDKALLIGINAYPTAPLRGCVNDVVLMYQILKKRFGFTNIAVIQDNQAIKQTIVASLKSTASGLTSGDRLFVLFSGHGSQVNVDDWTNSAEIDGREEIICPYDMNWLDPLRDDEIGYYVKNLPTGVKATIVLDCCHSGTGLRNCTPSLDVPVINKFMPPPVSEVLRNPDIDIDSDLRFFFPPSSTKEVKRNFLIDTAEQGNAVLIAGCKDNETSADAFIGGRYHGALTYAIYDVLSKKGYSVSYKNLIEDVNLFMQVNGYNQTPQLEARENLFDKMFLG